MSNADPTTRADALRDLTSCVEAGTLHEQPHGGMPMATRCYPRSGGRMDTSAWSDGACLAAYYGSLDAVAELEAPLQERGWRGPHIGPFKPEKDAADLFSVGWWSYAPKGRADAVGPTEPRARLLAVLKALLWECEHDPR